MVEEIGVGNVASVDTGGIGPSETDGRMLEAEGNESDRRAGRTWEEVAADKEILSEGGGIKGADSASVTVASLARERRCKGGQESSETCSESSGTSSTARSGEVDRWGPGARTRGLLAG